MILLTLLSLVGLLGEPTIRDGYIDRLSAFPGDSVTIYLNADTSASISLELFDLNGKVVAAYPARVYAQAQPAEKAYEDGYQYKPTIRIKVPEIPSGVYLWNNSIPMVVKNRNAKVIVLYSSNTENAYSPSGGKSLYDFNSLDGKKAVKVSFHRPIALPRHSEAFLRWIVNQSVEEVGYITDMDMDDYNEIRKASLLIVPGHSEYWTLPARKNFDRFVEDGKPALVLSGNTMWWQVRYNERRDQMICYKSTEDDKIKSPQLKTTRWNDPTLGYPITKSIGVEFPLAGYGRKTDKGWDGYRLVSQSPLLENSSLVKGDTLMLFTDEHDGAPLLGFDNDSIPVINRAALGFEKVEIIGYDKTTWSGADGIATWIVFKASKKSGIIINTASTDWCADNGIGFNADIQIITMNMIKKLLLKENVFSPDGGKESMPLLSN